ncbi:MAG TPA: hypothetical protein VKD67_12525 [Acidimicrobiales bacterium]|nr:hypothetical protein [Acidimicrobiales bacterium]
MTASHPTELSAALGWRFFAGIILLLLGIMNLIDGLIGVSDSDIFEQNLSTAPALPVTDRLEVWGWVVLVVGVVMMVLAFPVIVGFTWARFAGIAVSGIDLVLQFAYLAHFPLWSLIIIFLNVLVIFGLAARGGGPTELDSR